MAYREIGKRVLGMYLSIPRNIDILEARINLNSPSQSVYMKNLYDCVGYLSRGLVTEYHEDIKLALAGFNLRVYSDFVAAEHETDTFLEEDVDVTEGALSCPKCKLNKTFSYTKQVRSADEGTSVFARCYNCSHKWRES